MTTQKDRIESAIRHIQTATDVDPWAMELAVEALKAQIDKDTNVLVNDCISRQAAIDVLSLGKEILSRVLDDMDVVGTDREKYSWGLGLIESNIKDIEELPSAQPKPISGEYAKAVRNWLVKYQVKCAELQGRYTPYEVLGWIVSDWRKDNGIW